MKVVDVLMALIAGFAIAGVLFTLLDATSPEKLEPLLKAEWDNCTALFGFGNWERIDATPWWRRLLVYNDEIFCVDLATKERMGYGLPEVRILNSSDPQSWRLRK